MSEPGLSVRERALRKTDFVASFLLLAGASFVLRGQTLQMTRETGLAMYALSAAAFVFVVVVPILVHAVFKRPPAGGDEYLRKLLGISTASGFYLAFAAFAVWAPLSGTLLPELTAPQIIGLMLFGAGLSWLAMRWRDSHR